MLQSFIQSQLIYRTDDTETPNEITKNAWKLFLEVTFENPFLMPLLIHSSQILGWSPNMAPGLNVLVLCTWHMHQAAFIRAVEEPQLHFLC